MQIDKIIMELVQFDFSSKNGVKIIIIANDTYNSVLLVIIRPK
jgi:hypothetical protein